MQHKRDRQIGKRVVKVLIYITFKTGSKGFWEMCTLSCSSPKRHRFFFLASPYAVLDHREFLADLKFEAWHYSTAGHAGMEGDALRWYLAYLWDVEGLTALLAVLEALRGVCTRSRQTILLSFFPVIYFALISGLVVRNDRTLLPVTPFLFLLASSLLVNLLRRTGLWQSRRTLLVPAVGVLILVSLIWPALQTVRRTIRLVTVDSRETAREWIDHNLPTGSRIAIESYSPYVDPQRFSVQGVARMIDHTPDWYAANDFEYLVFGQYMFGRFYQRSDRYASEVSQYEELFNAFSLDFAH